MVVARTKNRICTHLAGEDLHCGVLEFICTGLNVPTAKQVAGM